MTGQANLKLRNARGAFLFRKEKYARYVSVKDVPSLSNFVSEADGVPQAQRGQAEGSVEFSRAWVASQ